MAIQATPESTTKVTYYQCDRWDDFISDLRRMKGKNSGGYIYRGQANTEWRLSSPIERWLHRLKGGDEDRNIEEVFDSSSYDIFRTGNIRAFKDCATGLPNFDPSNLDTADWLALARHHGLNTGILDWSYSPFVAAFFAFSDALRRANPELGSPTQAGIIPPTEPVAIWALAYAPDKLQVDDEFEYIEARAAINYWQKAQKGLFTKLYHAVYIDVERYLASRGLDDYLECYVIPGQETFLALSDLLRMNITHATLFPDLRGAAEYANLATVLGSIDFAADSP